MIRRLPLLAVAGLALAGIAAATFSASQDSQAATANIGVATPGVVLLPIHLSGQNAASVTAVAKIKLPFPARVLGVSANARASAGTDPTYTVNVLDDGVTILSAPIALTAGTVAEGTVTAPTIADESLITVNTVIGGTDSPHFDDVDIVITLVRI